VNLSAIGKRNDQLNAAAVAVTKVSGGIHQRRNAMEREGRVA